MKPQNRLELLNPRLGATAGPSLQGGMMNRQFSLLLACALATNLLVACGASGGPARISPSIDAASTSRTSSGATYVVVASYSSSSLQCFQNSASGAVLVSTIDDPGGYPEAITAPYGADQVIVANGISGTVVVYAQPCGKHPKVVRTIQPAGGALVNVAVARDGNIYTAYFGGDGNPPAIRKFIPSDNNGTQIPNPPGLTRDLNVAVNAGDTELCVAGFANKRKDGMIYCTQDQGASWTQVASTGRSAGMTFDTAGNLVYTAHWRTIEDPGAGIKLRCPDSFCGPIAFDANDQHLYTATGEINTALQLNWPSGALQTTYGGGNTTTGVVALPRG